MKALIFSYSIVTALYMIIAPFMDLPDIKSAVKLLMYIYVVMAFFAIATWAIVFY